MGRSARSLRAARKSRALPPQRPAAAPWAPAPARERPAQARGHRTLARDGAQAVLRSRGARRTEPGGSGAARPLSRRSQRLGPSGRTSGTAAGPTARRRAWSVRGCGARATGPIILTGGLQVGGYRDRQGSTRAPARARRHVHRRTSGRGASRDSHPRSRRPPPPLVPSKGRTPLHDRPPLPSRRTARRMWRLRRIRAGVRGRRGSPTSRSTRSSTAARSRPGSPPARAATS